MVADAKMKRKFGTKNDRQAKQQLKAKKMQLWLN
jgi:hypothetical protein